MNFYTWTKGLATHWW